MGTYFEWYRKWSKCKVQFLVMDNISEEPLIWWMGKFKYVIKIFGMICIKIVNVPSANFFASWNRANFPKVLNKLVFLQSKTENEHFWDCL